MPSRVADVIDHMRAPLLILAAGQDSTPVHDVEAFAERVRQANVSVDMTIYPDAPHSFFDRTFGGHRQDCDEAWLEMLSFMDRHANNGI